VADEQDERIDDRHPVLIPRCDVVEQAHGERRCPDAPGEWRLLVRVPSGSVERRPEGDQERYQDRGVGEARVIERAPQPHHDETEHEYKPLDRFRPVEPSPVEGEEERCDCRERPDHVLERVGDVRHYGEGGGVEHGHDGPDEPAHGVWFRVVLF